MKTPSASSSHRDAFLARISHSSRFSRLFDHLDGLSFFAKNVDGELMTVDQSLLDLYGFDDEQQIVGKTDFDLLPRRLAEKYRRDDVRVIETGAPMLNIVELFLNPQGMVSNQ